MSEYNAPLKDMNFLLEHVIGLTDIAKLPGCEDVTSDLVSAIFGEAGKFSKEVLAPINRSGDMEGAKISNNVVTTPKGFKEAYWKYVEGGSHRFHARQRDARQRQYGLQTMPVIDRRRG